MGRRSSTRRKPSNAEDAGEDPPDLHSITAHDFLHFRTAPVVLLQAIGKEAKEFGLGKTKYYLVVVFTAVITQMFFLGAVGTINYTSAMFGGIIISLSITITEVLAVFFFHEKFDGEKGVALALSLWGSASLLLWGV
ncbi:hypothetical protein HPP92_020823 [Vanilla planifolia]|uniref:Uncharacterized protein n=1 Tax=Vanilla planifolia TaxID=51239 RepID=A0A835Q3J9_VANPL|nr:hypothetical protein HPP92_020823 [Vanilla planifolia]